MAESWRDIAGFEGLYQISDEGRVWSARSRIFLQPTWNKRRKYLYVTLCGDGRRVRRHVHRLVLEAFEGPCPPGLECCHWNGDARNNSVTNLYWGTRLDNMRDRIRHGTTRRAYCRRNHELTSDNVWVSRKGVRRCKQCRDDYTRRYNNEIRKCHQ